MKFFVYLMTLLFVGTAIAQNPTILQGSYISNVFGNSNFVLNPNAQTSTANVTNATRSISTPLVATSEFTLNLTNGSFATWTLRPFDSGMKGQNCEARFTYRGFATATSTAQIVQNSLVVAQLVLTPTTDPRIASINFPCGDLVNATTFRIAQTTANMTTVTPNEIGGIYVGLATNMANVAQAEFVGGGEWTTSTGFTRSSSAIQSTFAAFTSGSAGTAVGKATSAGSDTTITFPYLPAGQYYVSINFYNYLYLGGVNNANCEFTIQEIDSNTNSAISSSGAFSITSIYPPASSLQGNFNFTTGGQRRFRIVSRNTIANGAGSLCVSLPDASVKAGIYVYRFPSSSELVVTPERQNVWGAVEYRNQNQSLFSGSAETTGNTSFNNATWNQSTLLKGKAAVTTTNSGNDLGFSIPNLPVGNYKLEISGQLYAQPGSTTVNDVTACTFRIFETTTSVTVAEQVIQGGRPTSSTNTANLTNSFQGIFNNTSVATRNFRLEANKTVDSNATNLGTCVAASSASGTTDATVISFSITPLDQPSNSALYVQGPVKAAETGAAIPASYVGHITRAYLASKTLTSSATWTNITSITIPSPGVYLINASAAFGRSGATFTSVGYLAMALSNTNNSDNASYGWAKTSNSTESAGFSTTFGQIGMLIKTFPIRYDGTTITWPDNSTTTGGIIYLNGYMGNFSSGSPQISDSEILLIKIN